MSSGRSFPLPGPISVADFDDVEFSRSGAVATIAINRPASRNALRVRTFAELDAAFQAADRDADIRAIILTGRGGDFCAGGDLKEMVHWETSDPDWYQAAVMAPFTTMGRLRTPIIAAVRGYALGGGTELALFSHIRIGGRSARFGLTEILHASLPGAGGTGMLHPIIGSGRALFHLLTGEMISAEQAERYGLITSSLWP